MAKNKREAMRTFEALANMPFEILPDKTLDVKRVERLGREYQAQQNRETAELQTIQTPDLKILFGDFREVARQISDASVDMIFTDPPYPKEYLPLWSDLAAIAHRILKPGGLLIAYSGQFHLPEVMSRLSEWLDYIWLGSLVLKGPHNEVHVMKIHNHSKPLLFYGKDYYPSVWFYDTFFSEGKDKEYHDWQQAKGAALYYIETLTAPGGLVFDPFLGGGTTAEAAVKLNRSFIGCDIDKSAVAMTSHRLVNDARREI